MHAVLLCGIVLVAVAVIAVVLGGVVLSGCLGMTDAQPDDWTRHEEDE